jgi:hypothetical protein
MPHEKENQVNRFSSNETPQNCCGGAQNRAQARQVLENQVLENQVLENQVLENHVCEAAGGHTAR